MAASFPNEPDDLLITDELRHRIAQKAHYQREKLGIQDVPISGIRLSDRLDRKAYEGAVSGRCSRRKSPRSP
jgi:hypothetical protein